MFSAASEKLSTSIANIAAAITEITGAINEASAGVGDIAFRMNNIIRKQTA